MSAHTENLLERIEVVSRLISEGRSKGEDVTSHEKELSSLNEQLQAANSLLTESKQLRG